MKRVHYAILMGEALSYALIIVFIFADAMFGLTGVFRADTIAIPTEFANISACLVGIVGCINVWLTWYYMRKAATMRDWLIVCAWTHRIKRDGKWLTLEEFLSEHLGYQVSHGLSEPSLLDLRNEADNRWRSFPTVPVRGSTAPELPHARPAGEASGPASG